MRFVQCFTYFLNSFYTKEEDAFYKPKTAISVLVDHQRVTPREAQTQQCVAFYDDSEMRGLSSWPLAQSHDLPCHVLGYALNLHQRQQLRSYAERQSALQFLHEGAQTVPLHFLAAAKITGSETL